jgi:hypothetical protein
MLEVVGYCPDEEELMEDAGCGDVVELACGHRFHKGCLQQALLFKVGDKATVGAVCPALRPSDGKQICPNLVNWQVYHLLVFGLS